MFGPNSRLIRFLTAVCDLMILNVLFLFSCITVVLAGDGAVSLYTVTLRMFRGTEESPGKSFLHSLKRNFLPSVPTALLLLTDMTLLAVLRGVLYAETLLLSPAVFVFLVSAAVFLTALLSYLFPLLARFDNTFPRHLGNAGRLAVEVGLGGYLRAGAAAAVFPAAVGRCGRVLDVSGIFDGSLGEFVLPEQDIFGKGLRRMSWEIPFPTMATPLFLRTISTG